MSRAAAAVLALAIGLASAACAFIPPEVTCNGVEPSTCQPLAQQVISQKPAEDASRRIGRLEIMDDRGSYALTFDTTVLASR